LGTLNLQVELRKNHKHLGFTKDVWRKYLPKKYFYAIYLDTFATKNHLLRKIRELFDIAMKRVD